MDVRHGISIGLSPSIHPMSQRPRDFMALRTTFLVPLTRPRMIEAMLAVGHFLTAINRCSLTTWRNLTRSALSCSLLFSPLPIVRLSITFIHVYYIIHTATLTLNSIICTSSDYSDQMATVPTPAPASSPSRFYCHYTCHQTKSLLTTEAVACFYSDVQCFDRTS
ncbi:hypothetical protein H2248_008422 [Termitomyces sp. 'cryptogamus']|nr:hypothetical protein H2248_008422 [Termitomyces sp. 'cryptogamus']